MNHVSLRAVPTGFLVAILVGPVLVGVVQVVVWIGGSMTTSNVVILVLATVAVGLIVASTCYSVRFDSAGLTYRSATYRRRSLPWIEVQEVDPWRKPKIGLALTTSEGIQTYSARPTSGTKFTMEQDFYKGRLTAHGLDVLVPPPADREIVHRVIYDELCLGQVQAASRAEYLRIMADLHRRGAEGIIEGCTEIVMLVQPQHTEIPLFDTTSIHAGEAVLAAIQA